MYGWKYFIFVSVLLLAALLAAHGHALNDGLFLDDHWHALRLAENDWSIAALFNSTTIAPDKFMHAWWQSEPISWWYVRPVAVLLAKIVYHLSGGSVKALHALSLALHLGNALLVHHLVLRMTRRRWWAVVAALLMLVYSHSVYAAAWLAAQNALLQTFLMLLALLAYVRASGLDIYAGPRDGDDDYAIDARRSCSRNRERATPSQAHGLRPVGSPPGATGELGGTRTTGAGTTNGNGLGTLNGALIPRLNVGWVVVFFVLWAMAILSRESAVILPVFAVGFDLAFGGWRQVRARLKPYAAMAAVAIGFTLWRVVFFNHPMPDFYVQRPQGPGYVLWASAKLLHYLTATVWLSPMTIGPSGRFNPWREAPADCVLMLVILAIMSVGYYMATRRVRGWWLWPTWIFLGLLPVVPILATPHNGYLPSVGFAIAMTLGAALRDKTHPTSVGRWCAGVATWFLIATTTYVPIYRPMWYSVMAAERMTIDQVKRMPPGERATDIFFINLPFVNIYATYHLDDAMGRGPVLGVPRQADPKYRTHVLTYAPDLLRMDQDCRLEQIDARRFRIRIIGTRPWFSGALGRFFIEGMRPGHGRFVAGQVMTGDQFDTRVVRADEQGVWELEFAFHEPLASERFCFYVGTPSCAAARVRFAGVGDIQAHIGARGEGQGVSEVRFAGVGDLQAHGLRPVGSPLGAASGLGTKQDLVTEVRATLDQLQTVTLAPRPSSLAPRPSPLAPRDVRAALDQLRAGRAAAADVLFAAMQGDDLAARSAALGGIGEICEPVAAALAGPAIGHGASSISTQATESRLHPAASQPTADRSAMDWAEIRQWWARHVDDTAVRVLPRYGKEFEAARWQRDALFRIRQTASNVIQTDLYLTGPPFPGPR